MHQTKCRGIITEGRIIDVLSLGTGLLAGETPSSFVVILRQIRKQNPKIIPSAIENTVNVHVLPIHTVKNHVISTGEKSVVAFYICHRGQQSADF